MSEKARDVPKTISFVEEIDHHEIERIEVSFSSIPATTLYDTSKKKTGSLFLVDWEGFIWRRLSIAMARQFSGSERNQIRNWKFI